MDLSPLWSSLRYKPPQCQSRDYLVTLSRPLSDLAVGLSGGLEDPRRSESGVSWTRFDDQLTLRRPICQMQDIFRTQIYSGSRVMRVIERLAWRIRWVIEQTVEGLKRFF